MSDKKPYNDIIIKKLEHSEIEITGNISKEVFESYKSEALKNINKDITLPGFRKGFATEQAIIGKIGEMPILEEMAELAIAHAYPEIINDHKLDVIGRPNIQITKLAKNNPLEFKATTAVLPEVTVGDYKKIAATEMKKDNEEITVTDKDVEDVILQIRKSRVDHSHHDHSLSTEEHDKEIEKEMPEFTDEFVKTLGDFKDVNDFKIKIRESIKQDKLQKAKEKKRIKIAEAIIESSKVDLPKIIIETELDKMEAQFNDDINRMGVKTEDYLAHIKKTTEDLRKEWRKDAEKKAIFQLILNKISLVEKIKPDMDKVEEEVKHITDHYKNADPERARIYAASLLTNEKVFEFLESQK